MVWLCSCRVMLFGQSGQFWTFFSPILTFDDVWWSLCLSCISVLAAWWPHQVSIFDFTVHEVKTVWLPILILGYVLRSPRLLLLALTPMLFEILVGFGFLYFVSLTGLNISYYALMIMLMLIMALSWDYALFMLTRYKAEREAGATVEQAIVEMVAKSGSIVVVSGGSVSLGNLLGMLQEYPVPRCLVASGFTEWFRKLLTWTWNDSAAPEGWLLCATPIIRTNSKNQQNMFISQSLWISQPLFRREVCDSQMAMDQCAGVPLLRGWPFICQLFWCSPGYQGFDNFWPIPT